jgi:hypothetical protein
MTIGKSFSRGQIGVIMTLVMAAFLDASALSTDVFQLDAVADGG